MPTDFATLWKVASIVLTGAFGVLGLLTEFKDKNSRKVTKWGMVSLGGIIISVTFGVIAQYKEFSKQQKDSADRAKQTLALAEKAEESLQDIKRSMSPLDLVNVGFEFDGPCTDRKYRPFCLSLGTYLWNYAEPKWKLFPSELREFTDNSTLAVNLLVFVDPAHVEAFVSNSPDKPQPQIARPDLASTPECRQQKIGAIRKQYVVATKLDNDTFRVSLNHCPAAWAYSSGEIRSVLDLPGATLLIGGLAGGLRIFGLTLTFKNGERVKIKELEQITGKSGATYYKAQISKLNT